MNGRELALQGLIEFERGRKKLKNFTGVRKGERADKSIQKAYDYYYGPLKMIKRLDYILEKHLKKRKLESLPLPIRNILREGAYGLLFSNDPEMPHCSSTVRIK